MTLLSDTQLLDKIFAHVDGRTSDKGDSVWREPVENYSSEARFQAELQVMRRLPVVFCPSGAVSEHGDYISRVAAGVPLLVVRGEDGKVRAFRNACRHRGMQVAEGEGCKKTFICPYHNWAYGTDGALKHIPSSDGFPGIDKATHGLVPVYDVQERSGLIFVTQDRPLSDGALADLPDLLGEEQTVFNTITVVDQANWKLIGETSMEGYHIRALHNKSFYPYGYDNLNVVELFGRNSRIVFPFRRVQKLRDRPREEWSLQGCVTDVIQLFPNAHTSTLTNHVMLIILEPVSLNETRWIIYQMRPTSADATFDEDKARRDADFVQKTGLREDRAAAKSIQDALPSGANTHFTFGHYEAAIAHFHRQLTDHVEMAEALHRHPKT